MGHVEHEIKAGEPEQFLHHPPKACDDHLSALLEGLFDTLQASNEVRGRLRERLRLEGREALHRELQGVDAETAARVHVNDTQRLLRGLEIYQATGLPWSEHIRRQRQVVPGPQFRRLLLLGLGCDRDLLTERIRQRSLEMMGDAFSAEVEGLLARGYGAELPSMQAIGYRHMAACLAGAWDRDTATRALVLDTKRYAKRQMTWFRRYAAMRWHDRDEVDRAMLDVVNFLRKNNG